MESGCVDIFVIVAFDGASVMLLVFEFKVEIGSNIGVLFFFKVLLMILLI